MDWRNIPSLAGLRAFEATARLNSFSAAGRELNVTHAAIAQHVRGLEDFFSQSLLYRQGRKMELTPSGQRLAQSLSEGFLTIQAGINDLHAESDNRPLKVTLTPSFAESWLMPRLGEFWAKHPDIELTLLPSIGLTDLRRDGVDLAIRYGKGVWSGYHTELLASAQFVVVATETYIKGCKTYKMSDLSNMKWLLESDRQDQVLWAEEQGLDLSKVEAAKFPTATLTHLAARAGYGAAIVTRAIVERDLESGALVELFAAESSTLGYYLVTRKEAQSKNLTAFIKWLRSSKESK